MVLKELREKNNLSQQELSDKLDVKRSTYAMWETGKSVPKTTDLPKIAKLLNVTVLDVVNCFADKK